MTQYNLGVLHGDTYTENPLDNLKKAKTCLESALTVWTETGFPEEHRRASTQLSDVEEGLTLLVAMKQNTEP